MMGGTKDLLASERGVFCILILVAATVLAALKVITGADWLTLAKWLAVALVTSKTVTGAADRIVGGKDGTPIDGTQTP
jgi:hypothetical protein